MNCDDLFKLLPDYLDSDLKLELCGELRDHIRECSYCRAHVNTMEGTIELVREIVAPEAHHEWVAQLRKRLDCGPESPQ